MRLTFKNNEASQVQTAKKIQSTWIINTTFQSKTRWKLVASLTLSCCTFLSEFLTKTQHKHTQNHYVCSLIYFKTQFAVYRHYLLVKNLKILRKQPEQHTARDGHLPPTGSQRLFPLEGARRERGRFVQKACTKQISTLKTKHEKILTSRYMVLLGFNELLVNMRSKTIKDILRNIISLAATLV